MKCVVLFKVLTCHERIRQWCIGKAGGAGGSLRRYEG